MRRRSSFCRSSKVRLESILFSGDGCGYCKMMDEGFSPIATFVFTDGEIWSIDTWHLNYMPALIILNEAKYVKSLTQCAEFLSKMQISGPYRWVAGIEGVKGRYLAPPDSLGRKWGPWWR